MTYITHRRYRKVAACGEQLNIPYGTELEVIGSYIVLGAKAVCNVRSDDAYRYFARNDDGKGIERGLLTYAIAYRPRDANRPDGLDFRFTDEEIGMIVRDYPYFVKDTEGFIHFNYDFFNADVDVLNEFNKKLGGQNVSCIER